MNDFNEQNDREQTPKEAYPEQDASAPALEPEPEPAPEAERNDHYAQSQPPEDSTPPLEQESSVPPPQSPQQTPTWQEPYTEAPYSPRYGENTYPPRPPYPDANAGNGYPPGPYQPYQYNANSGWQQPPPRPPEKYEWKFEDYDQFDNTQKRKRRSSRGLIVFTVAFLCVMAVGLVTLAGYGIWTAASQDNIAGEETETSYSDIEAETETTTSQLEIASSPESGETTPLPEGKLSIPEVAEAVLPSVVGVVMYENDQYFEISNYGSGIVMTEDGHIITNAHVVAGGTGFKVQFADGDAVDAELIGFDTMTDLAVLKIIADGLVPARFGDSDSIRVGEPVVAIGNPAGMQLASSVTSGIISAVNREVRTSNYNMTFIQTDAAINPGNSGGALANEYGQVIGINSSKIMAEGYEGIGFAIPITSAKPVIDDIIAHGKVTGRVMLGIQCRQVDEIDARNYDIQMGLVIEGIDEASGLNDVGVMRGDILTHIDEERVYNLSDVRDVLERHKPGDTVTLTFYRRVGTKEQTFDVQTELIESGD